MKKYNPVYFVGGINGSGKTSLLKGLKHNTRKFNIFSGSKGLMNKLSLSKGNYVALQSLSDKFKQKATDKMMYSIIKKNKRFNRPLIIDAHYFNYKRGKIVDVVGDWISLVDALFLIVADINEILKRIGNDFDKNKRKRNIFPLYASKKEKYNIIKYYTHKTLKKIKILSNKFKIPYFVIENHDGFLDKAANDFIFYEKLFKSGYHKK